MFILHIPAVENAGSEPAGDAVVPNEVEPASDCGVDGLRPTDRG